MRQPENVFINSVHKHLPASLYRIKNNNVFNAGQADCWYSGNRADLWIEYKFITLPKRGDTLIDLVSGKSPSISHLQQDWLRKRFHEGRSVGVLVGCKEGGVWFPGVGWDGTYAAAAFKSTMSSRKDLAQLIINQVSK